MKIVTSNDILMAMVPNVVTTVEGEKPLFEKISHQMEMSEAWARDTFTGNQVLDEIADEPASDGWKYLASMIVCDALRRAIPSLDVVLTPNGFGIVSNTNVAPASKERIERLVNQMAAQRDHFINMLLADLRTRSSWCDSAQFRWFTASLIQAPKACVTAVYDRQREGQQWDQFLQLRDRAITIEDAIAEKWISYDVMATLRVELATVNNATIHQVALKVRACVLNELRGNARNHWDLDRIVNFIRKNADIFPEWAASDTAKLYDNPPVFKNKKNSSGYFF